MQTNAVEAMQDAGIAPPRHLLELVGRAQRSIDADPAQARRCLAELAALLSDRRPEAIERALLPSAVPTGGASTKGGLAAWQIRRVREHIEQRLEDTILIEDLAAITRLSPGHFCRAFKATAGEPPHAYLVRQRIRRAQQLMLTTRDPLSEIACACGLTDQAHLTRLFRRFVDDTPLAWRRARQAA